jgi:O-antigen ligase
MPFVFTLSGRTIGVWHEGWGLFLESPLLGFGFHADRIFLEGQHMHNSLLHALVQTGLIGTVLFILAFIWAWIILFRLLKKPRFRNQKNLP